MIVFGLGSGGCGLASLAALLAAQQGSMVTKERLIRLTAWHGSLSVELGLMAALNRAGRLIDRKLPSR